MDKIIFKVRASPVTFLIRQETGELAYPLLKFYKSPIEPLSRGAKRKEVK